MSKPTALVPVVWARRGSGVNHRVERDATSVRSAWAISSVLMLALFVPAQTLAAEMVSPQPQLDNQLRLVHRYPDHGQMYLGSNERELRTLRTALTAGPQEPLRIGLSLQPTNALMIIALDQNFLEDEGIDVSVTKYVSGTRALVDGLFAGQIDVTTASDAPIALNAFARQDFRAIATVFGVNNQNRVIARLDRGITRHEDLRGKRIATQRGSAVHYFLSLFLLDAGLSESDVELRFMRPDQMPEALAHGDIEAFSMREPFIGEARALLGNKTVTFAVPGLYDQTDEVVVTSKLLAAHPDVIEKLLRALVRSERFAQESPRRSQEIVARSLGTSAAEIATNWPQGGPRVRLDQSLLLRLENIARWAVRRNLVKAAAIPNFLDFIYTAGLKTVNSPAVSVIK